MQKVHVAENLTDPDMGLRQLAPIFQDTCVRPPDAAGWHWYDFIISGLLVFP